MESAFDLTSRRRYLKMSNAGLAALPALWQLVEPALAGVLNRFYEHMQTTPELAPMFEGRNIEGLKRAQYMHWKSTFENGFDDSYAERIARIGQGHVRIGLEPRWFIGAYSMIFNDLLGVVDAKTKWNAAARVQMKKLLAQVIFMDMDAIVSVYYAVESANRKKAQQELADGLVKHFDSATSVQLESVAAATEELSSSVSGIERQVHNAAELAMRAHTQGQAAQGVNARLRSSTSQIAGVVELIREVAEQTNLLALNAAIEAARAGDAGRGFAVVASEVKKLAQTTTEATEDISAKIADIQTAAGNVVNLAEETEKNVEAISQSMQQISMSVREQGEATRSISASMTDVQGSLQTLMANMAECRK